MIFLYNSKTTEAISYETLLRRIEDNDIQSRVINERDPIKFYIKLLTNIIYNIDSVIIDSDHLFTDEDNGTDENLDNKVDIETKKRFNSWNEFLEKVKKTKSKITIFTSGTTGSPKKVVHTVGRFIEMSRVGRKYESNKWALLYNISHMAGFQVFFQAFLNKNTLVYLFEASRDEFFSACDSQEISHVSATPTFYRLLSPFNFKLNKVKKCTLGGEKCDTQLINKLNTIFPNASIHNIYASTEAGSLFISKGESFKVLETLRGKVKFIENEIVIHKSLLGDFELDGWFFTGDLVQFIDENNTEFKIISRKSDTVNVGGNRVNLLEVEHEITQIKGVINAKVYAINNSVLGKIIACDVMTTIAYTKKEFKDLLRGRLQFYKIPTKVKFVQKLQTTRTGKLKRI